MATPTDPAPTAETPAEQAPATGSAGVYQYLDEIPRTYTFHDGTVITPQRGDVCALPYDPGDGRWQPSKAKPTRLPDNDPKQAAKNAAEQAEARAQVLAKANEQAAAAAGKA